MDPIRVLHIIDKLSMDGVNPSSCAVLIRDWAGQLHPEKVDISVTSLRNPDPAGKVLENNCVHVDYIGHGKISYKNIPALTKIVYQRNIDILHLHGYSSANFGRIVARKTGRFNVVHEHAVLKVQPHQYFVDWLQRRHTDVAVAVSRNVAEFMVHGRSIPKSKVHIIGNGISLDRFQACDSFKAVEKRRELRIDGDNRIIGTVTRLRQEKGTIILIRAMKEIINHWPNIILLVVGEGPQRKILEKTVNDLQLKRYVKFLGFRSDVAELMSIFDVTVIPSLSEGFPLALAEAMAVGRPIVATRVGGMVDVGKDYKDVLFVPPNDHVRIAEKVLLLLNDQSLAKRLGESAKIKSKMLSVEKSADQLYQLYHQLIRN